MKKKLISGFLSTLLILQCSIVSQASEKEIDNFSKSTTESVENDKPSNSKIFCVLKRIGETALALPVLYKIYKWLYPSSSYEHNSSSNEELGSDSSDSYTDQTESDYEDSDNDLSDRVDNQPKNYDEDLGNQVNRQSTNNTNSNDPDNDPNTNNDEDSSNLSDNQTSNSQNENSGNNSSDDEDLDNDLNDSVDNQPINNTNSNGTGNNQTMNDNGSSNPLDNQILNNNAGSQNENQDNNSNDQVNDQILDDNTDNQNENSGNNSSDPVNNKPTNDTVDGQSIDDSNLDNNQVNRDGNDEDLNNDLSNLLDNQTSNSQNESSDNDLSNSVNSQPTNDNDENPNNLLNTQILNRQNENSDNNSNDTGNDQTINGKIQYFEGILQRYEGSQSVSKDELLRICDEVQPLLSKEPNLLEINGPTTIVGDVHGDMNAVAFCCRKFLREVQSGKSILFLGDYVDRGPNSIKNVALLFKLKTLFPGKVWLLRGNHEDININCNYGFSDEFMKAYGKDSVFGRDAIFTKVNNVFTCLPLAAVINKSTFCVHGGISPCLSKLEDICKINRLVESPQLMNESLIQDLLWSDPTKYVSTFGDNSVRRAGKIYGKDAVNNFLTTNNLRRIVRAHEEEDDGYNDVFSDGRVITIFSAPNYCDRGCTGKIMNLLGDSITYENVPQ